MKTKGITIWERHAEKIVLLIAAAMAIGFTALQFVGKPNAVETRNGLVGPGDVDGLLQERAEQLLARLGDDADAGVQLPDPVPALDELLRKREQPLIPAPELPQFDLALAPVVAGVGRERLALPVPEIPVPQDPAVAQYADALADGVVEQFGELANLFPDPNQPRDLIFATASARFDLAELREQFQRSSGGDKGTVIPSSWYDDRPENIVDIVVERQERDGNGEWTNPTTLEPIPGQMTFRTQLVGDVDAGLRDQMLTQLADPERQLALIEPPFYPTKNNDWTPPQLDLSAGGTQQQIKDLKERRRLALEKLEQMIEEFEAAGGSMEDREGGDRGRGGAGGGDAGGSSGRRPPPGGGGRPPPGGGGGFGEGGGDIGKRGGDDREPGKASKFELDRMYRQIQRQQRAIAAIEDDLRNLGVPAEEFDLQADGGNQSAALEAGEILVWAHDLNVVPGHIYRYRLTVRVYNPFFGRDRYLVDEQQSLAEPFAMESAASEWSEPIRIHPPLRVFVTSATPDSGPLGLGRATAEVYRFYDGQHWMETFHVTPGNAIGDVRDVRLPDGKGTIKIDFRTSFYLLDIIQEVGTDRREDRGARMPDSSTARALLEDLQTGETQVRDPDEEMVSVERSRLKDRAG